MGSGQPDEVESSILSIASLMIQVHSHLSRPPQSQTIGLAMFNDAPDVIFARQQAFPCTVPMITSDLCDYKATDLHTWAGLKDALRYAPRPIHYLTFRYPVKDSAGHTKVSLNVVSATCRMCSK